MRKRAPFGFGGARGCCGETAAPAFSFSKNEEGWDLQRRLDLLENLGELLPVVHDGTGAALIGEELGHLLHLLGAVLDAVDTDVADEGNAGTLGGSGTALAVLDGDALLVLDAQLLASVVVDSRVGLAGRGVQAGSGTVDMLVGEVVINADLLYAGDDTGLGGGADNGHGVALLLQALKLLRNAGAGLALLAQLGGDGAELAVNVGIDLIRGHGEAVLLLQADEHAAEVVADEVLQQLLNGVALRLAPFLQDLVSQVRAGLEGQTL